MHIRMLLLVVVAAMAGCANPGIIETSPNTYMLSRVDHGGIFGNASALKASVITDANTFAKSKGMVAIPITMNESPMYPGHFASFDYQFRLVLPDDAAARSTPMLPRANVVIEQTERKSVDVHQTTTPSAPDTYTELLKLDDLRKRNIITEEEFQTQKAKLLASR